MPKLQIILSDINNAKFCRLLQVPPNRIFEQIFFLSDVINYISDLLRILNMFFRMQAILRNGEIGSEKEKLKLST